MITQDLANKALDLALSKGGDFAELYIEDTESNSLTMLNGDTDNASSSRRVGCGVRVVSGTNYVYTYTAGLGEKDILAAAQAAADATDAEKQAEAIEFEVKAFSAKIEKQAADVDNSFRAKLLLDAHNAAKSVDSRIAQVKAVIADTDKRVLICNSEGLFASDRRANTRIRIQSIARDGSETQTGMASPGKGCGYELFDRIDVAQLGKQASEMAITMLTAPECPSGRYPVVIDGGFGGVVFHEACGHSLETTAVSRGNSEFCGKLGQQIASEKVTAIDDGTIPGEWGTLSIDDEGHPTQRNVLIEKGILKGYMSDMIGSRRMGIARSGNGRRQDYTFAPTSRMTNTFIAAGEDDDEEMISTLGTGLYAKTMGGGSVNPLTGEFNFAVNEGYWVKDGKILCAVRGASLIGKGGEVLMNIDRVGKNVELAAGVCGSVSGDVPTNVGQPRIRIKELTVGGKGGAL